MGDCQSKSKSDDVSEPTIESTEKPSNESKKEPVTETQKSPDQIDHNNRVAAPVEAISVKHKPENATSFG